MMSISGHEKEVAGWEPSRRLKYERTLLRLLVAARIENLLDGLNLRQVDLAKRIGKSSAWVSKLLSGRQNLTLDTLAEIGWALGVRWDPQVQPAPRENTPAAADPPLPGWVQRHGEITIRYVEAPGNAVTSVSQLSHDAAVGATSWPLIPWIIDSGSPITVGETTAQAAVVNCVSAAYQGSVVWTAIAAAEQSWGGTHWGTAWATAGTQFEAIPSDDEASGQETFDIRTEVTT
jgi:transcriptional regulator with XRE-family HTH domain